MCNINEIKNEETFFLINRIKFFLLEANIKLIKETDILNVLVHPQRSYINANIFLNHLYEKYF